MSLLTILNAKKQNLPALAITGRTLVNLLGRDGNFETLPAWTNTYSSVSSLDAINYKYGTQGLKLTIASGQTSGEYYKTFPVDSSKYYIALVDAKNGNATNNCRFYNGTVIADTTKFNTSYKKFSSVATIEVGVYVQGIEGQYAYFDGVRLYEIDLATYNKIDIDPDFTGERLASHFPYVDSVQFKANTLVSAKGKNLFSDTTEIGTINSSTGANMAMLERARNIGHITCRPNTPYTIKLPTGYKINRVFYYSHNKEYISNTQVDLNQSTFTTPANTSFLRVAFYNPTASIITQDDLNLLNSTTQLELGSTATPFKPQVKTQAHCSLPLATDDKVYITGTGSVYKKAWEKNVQLTGDLGWTTQAKSTGYMRVNPSGWSITPELYKGYCVKYDGKVLTTANSGTIDSDYIYLNSSGYSGLLITMPDADTGWVNVSVPIQAEIKAYFYGWKMCASDGSTYVSGTKYWKKLTDGTGITSTCPTASYAGFTPYMLSYKLASPQWYVNLYQGSKILSDGSSLKVAGAIQLEQKTGYDWATQADQANQYAITVPTLAVDNPTGIPYTGFDCVTGRMRKGGHPTW